MTSSSSSANEVLVMMIADSATDSVAENNRRVIDDDDKQATGRDLKFGARRPSRYDAGAASLYVITERYRSTTTVPPRSEH